MTSKLHERNSADLFRLPHAEAGNRVGLFGGSFNPPHSGHALVAETALKRVGLNQLWWLVTPGNPLKEHQDLAPLRQRAAAVRRIMTHPAMHATAFEDRLGTVYTAKTLQALKTLRPQLEFFWVMGADSLADLHRWRDWRFIFESVPVIVVDRPGASLAPLSAKAAQAYASCRLDETDARALGDFNPPVWVFLHARRDPSSSTELRSNR